MPVSATSAKQKPKRHRIVNRTSVDESLFGPPARFNQMTGNRKWNDASASALEMCPEKGQGGKGERGKRNSEMVQIITKDLIRKIKIPSTPDPSGMTVVLDNNEYDRIVRSARVLTLEERKEMEQKFKLEKTTHMEASNSRKMEMQKYEQMRKKNEKPSDIERESMEKGSEIMAKATAILEEQEDEIKKLNETILNAKCHAIRDAQLKEKEEILTSLKDEDARLDMMMEIERLKTVQSYEKREQDMQLQRLKGAEVIQCQIKEREQHRLLDMEKKDQETQAMLRYLDRLQEEDMENIRKRKMTQINLMEDVSKCNEEIQRQKAQHREQMKMEDLKVLEYIKEKTRIEEEQKSEAEKLKAEKEREIARLRAQQERAKDKQSEKDALRAKRRQEQYERDARQKEKDEAIKKSNTERMLIEARGRQIHHKEHFLAIQAKQDRDEFNRVLQVQQDQMKQEKLKAKKAAAQQREHATEIRKQVRSKEEEKINARKAFFEEGIKLDQEAQERRRKLDEIKQRKLEELKAVGIPDKYCAEVSRRITAPPPSFTMSGRS